MPESLESGMPTGSSIFVMESVNFDSRVASTIKWLYVKSELVRSLIKSSSRIFGCFFSLSIHAPACLIRVPQPKKKKKARIEKPSFFYWDSQDNKTQQPPALDHGSTSLHDNLDGRWDLVILATYRRPTGSRDF